MRVTSPRIAARSPSAKVAMERKERSVASQLVRVKCLMRHAKSSWMGVETLHGARSTVSLCSSDVVRNKLRRAYRAGRRVRHSFQ